MKKKRRRRRINRKRQLRIHIALFFVTILALILITLFFWHKFRPEDFGGGAGQPAVPAETETLPETENTEEGGEQEDHLTYSVDLKETDIYTFLQGPVAWNTKADWSGAWCDEFLAGQKFSVFGCGLCDLANIYSTLTPCDCSPLDMYEYAQEASGYTPVDGFGAIDWPYLQETLLSTGIYSEIMAKDETYEEFQEKVAGSISVIALVCSYNDSTYWEDVEGHYVNLWLYDQSDDTVLLGDSGNPAHNRQRIPLKYVYDALKTASDYQYLLVTAVDENGNTWQHDGIEGEWKKPSYYH